MKKLENLSDEEIVELNIPTGKPLIYEFDDNLQVMARYFLEDIRSATAAA